MSAKTLLFVIAAYLIGGCAQMPGAPPPSPPPGKTYSCTGANCDVKVSVKCTLYVFCWIEADPEWLQVPRGNSPVITWEVRTSGYTFSDNGIAFPSGSPFRCNAAGKTKFICNDMHTAPGKYKYTITLIGFPFVLPNDPWVENE